MGISMLVKVEYNEWYNAQNWYFQPTFHRFEACVYWFSMHFAKLSIVSVHEGKKVSSEIWKRHFAKLSMVSVNEEKKCLVKSGKYISKDKWQSI